MTSFERCFLTVNLYFVTVVVTVLNVLTADLIDYKH